MVQLPPGSANPVSLPVYSTWVFTPNPNSGSINSVSIWNTGSNTAYIGRSGVKQQGGFPIAPGNRPVRLQNINYALYAACDVNIGTLAGTVSGALTAGSTTLVTAASVPTATAAVGSVLVIGSTVNSAWEAVVISTIGTNYTTFGTSAMANDHNTTQLIYAGTAMPTSVVVQAGML